MVTALFLVLFFEGPVRMVCSSTGEMEERVYARNAGLHVIEVSPDAMCSITEGRVLAVRAVSVPPQAPKITHCPACRRRCDACPRTHYHGWLPHVMACRGSGLQPPDLDVCAREDP